MNIVLFGASDHCRYTIDIIEKQGKYNIVGILDKTLEKDDIYGGYKILGYLDDFKQLIEKHNVQGGIVAIGDNFTRKTLVSKILTLNPDFNFINAIHPSVIIGKNVTLGIGSVFMAGVIINNDCKIGNHCFLATKSSIDHDSEMGDYSSFSPGVTTGGRVIIGNVTAIGIGATIIHYKKIGNNSVVGGNSFVNKDIEDNKLAFGSPVRVIREREENEKYL